MFDWLLGKKKDDKDQDEESKQNKKASPKKSDDGKPAKKAKFKKSTAKKSKAKKSSPKKSTAKKSTPKKAEKQAPKPTPEEKPEPQPQTKSTTDTTTEKPKKSDAPKEQGWLSRLVGGLSKSSNTIVSGITDVITKRKLDDDTLQDLEDILIMSDIGPKASARFVANISKDRFDKEITDEEIRTALADEIATVLAPVAQPLILSDNKPHVILVVGVNGSGKTTTIGKLAQKFSDDGKSVMLAAGDTFRAAAVEQLQVWGERTNSPVVTKDEGSDAAALAYEAIEKAKSDGADVLIIDTAGRLHNKDNLMSELEKVVRVIKKHDDNYPHDTVMVLDATIGQNTVNQVQIFGEKVGVTGLIVTKLDGTAKGGVLIQLADEFQLPVHAIGVGEGIDDLQPFEADQYAGSLMGTLQHKV